MTNRKKWMIALVLTSVCNGLWAQKSEWTLRDCIDYSLQNNISLKKNRVALLKTETDIKEAKAGLLPDLNASTSQSLQYRPFQKTAGNLESSGIAVPAADKTTQSGSYGINASWTVWDGGKKRMAVQAGELSHAMAGLTAAATANTIQEQIARLYIQILYLKESDKVNEELVRQDSAVCERGKELMAQGQLSSADVAQLSAQVSSGRYDLVNVRTQTAAYETQLRQLLELAPEENIGIAPLTVADEAVLAPIPDKTGIYAAALRTRPEIESGELAVAQSRLATKMARAGRYPSVSMTGGLGDSHITGARSNFFSQMKTNFAANLGVSVHIPILDNRKTKSATERAQADELTALLDLEDSRKQLYSNIETYWLDAWNSRQRYLASRDNVQSRQTSYDLIQEQFRLGLRNIAELLNSRGEPLMARQNLLQDKYTSLLNRTLLEFYGGKEISL